jgi:phospho-2-dehydro-3-deoxyheptonate aldolase
MGETAKQLEQHWALDHDAANVLGDRIESDNQQGKIEEIVGNLSADGIKRRDENRAIVGDIFTNKLQEGMIIIGPCSLDEHTDYDPLFDYVEELQESNPSAVIGLRLNFAKPRTSGGWTGLWYSSDPESRAKIFDTYTKAFNRGIPILAEMTQETQLGALAPWMSGVWLGARDIPSTTLRSAISAYHLPVGIKNGMDGDPKTISDTMKAIRSNSEKNDGSGVDLGTIASTSKFSGIATGILPVGEGNMRASIIARGHELPATMSAEEKRSAAIDYLSAMCVLGAKVGSAVLIDGTHSVPSMFDINKKNPDRILPVLEEFNKAIEQGEVVGANRLAGVLAEVGPNVGRTDPNFVLDDERKQKLASLIKVTARLMSAAH